MIYATDEDVAVLDCIRKTVDGVSLPSFRMNGRRVSGICSDNDWFRKIAELRAFSAARSNLVSAMIHDGAFEKTFAGFDVRLVARMDAETILERHWDGIKAIRFKKKVGEILQAAKSIVEIDREFGGFNAYLQSWSFPERIRQLEDIERFWEAFDELQNDLKSRRMPIIKNEVTLLHFLENDMHLDCLKPDVVVMRVATNTGLVPSSGSERRNRLTVQKVQEYCTQRDVRPAMVDRYLLAFGGQTWAQELVERSFCTKNGECASPDCPLRKYKLCLTGIKK